MLWRSISLPAIKNSSTTPETVFATKTAAKWGGVGKGRTLKRVTRSESKKKEKGKGTEKGIRYRGEGGREEREEGRVIE